jgi:hypothetical protein
MATEERRRRGKKEAGEDKRDDDIWGTSEVPGAGCYFGISG